MITKWDMVNYCHFDIILLIYITFQKSLYPAGVHGEVCQPHSWTNSRYIRIISTPDIHIDIWNFSAIAQVLKSNWFLFISPFDIPISVFIVGGCIYTFTRTRFQFHAVSRRVYILRAICPLSMLLHHDFVRRDPETILKRRHFGFKMVKRKETKEQLN